MAYLLKVLAWVLLSIAKFIAAPFLMMMNPTGEDWTWIETVLITTTGAAIGVFVFYHFGEWLSAQLSRFKFRTSKKKKVFTRSRRMFVRLKSRFGIVGLIMISVFISVPLTAILGARLYKHDKAAIPKLIIGFAVWSVLLTTIAYLIRFLG